MLEPASRFFSSLGAAVLVFLSLAAPASAQRTQPAVILPGDQVTYYGYSLVLSGDTLAVGTPGDGTVWIHERNQGGANQWGRVAAANNFLSFDGTGADVDLSGDFLVAGNSFFSPSQGAVRIFERNRGGADFWGHLLTLTSSDPADAPFFGVSVAISGDTIAIGVGDNASPAGSSPAAASVYIFKQNQGGTNHWGEVRKVTLPDIAGTAISVVLQGDTLIAGALRDDGRGAGAGAVYVFERNQGGAEQWGQVQKLTASDGASGHHFGASAEISGNTIVVGAPGDLLAPGARAAYIFERSQGTWNEVRKLPAPDTNTVFGWSVAIDGDIVLVSAGIPNDPGSSAYVFRRNLGGPDQWGEAGRLLARDTYMSLTINGNIAVVGNPDWGELFGPEVYVFDLGQVLAQDVPALAPSGLAAMALLLLAAGWWISGRERAKGSRPEGL